MSFIRYQKKGNQEYAYEITAYWDPVEKKPRQKSRYLGVVIDKEKKLFVKKSRLKGEKLILDFGDTYAIDKFLRKKKLTCLLQQIFKDKTQYLLVLIYYRLCHPSAMRYAQTWYEGNIARLLFKGIDVSSQRISDFLKLIGDEGLQREFFRKYISTFIKPKKGIIIDTTALPNQIHLPLTMWGYNDGEIDKQIRFLLIVDKKTSLPLFFRYLPGNVVDVSSLITTIEELKKYGIKKSFVFIDAGFFSKDNIKGLYAKKIQFLTRLPATTKLYKKLIKEESRRLERFRNAVRYGKRALFIKRRTVELFGKKVYVNIILDPERKGRETRKLLLEMMDEASGEDEKEIEYKLMKKGIMILISSFRIKKEEILPLYYLRQMAEKLFRFSKDDLKLIPLRVHKEETLRGYLFLLFITLIAYVFLKKEIGKKFTVEEILLTTRNLKCKVYEDEIIIQEINK